MKGWGRTGRDQKIRRAESEEVSPGPEDAVEEIEGPLRVCRGHPKVSLWVQGPRPPPTSGTQASLTSPMPQTMGMLSGCNQRIVPFG